MSPGPRTAVPVARSRVNEPRSMRAAGYGVWSVRCMVCMVHGCEGAKVGSPQESSEVHSPPGALMLGHG